MSPMLAAWVVGALPRVALSLPKGAFRSYARDRGRARRLSQWRRDILREAVAMYKV
jgi:hypothetical protein